MITKNRIVMPAMSTNYATEDGFVTERLKTYYEERAKGGVGLIITEMACISPSGRSLPFELRIDDDRFIPGLSELVQAVQVHGAKVAVQLHHAGMETTAAIAGSCPAGPSPGINSRHLATGELSLEEIAQIVVCYAKAAERAKKAGFDGVEIHSAHYYLPAQFLSRIWNKRIDSYGGKLENRTRFLLEIIKATKEAVGKAFPVWCRINGEEYGAEDGLTLDEARGVAQMAEKIGCDAIHVSASGLGNQVLRGVTVREEGALVNLAKSIKRAISIPVIAVGRIDPTLGEHILRADKADFVAMGRTLITDPHLPKKASSGDLMDIRPCINCLHCIDSIEFKGLPLECSVNATVGKEGECQLIPVEKPKKVMVIGGGPAGMEAARIASLRGHKVLLYEKEAKLGGQLLQASVPPFKDDIDNFTNYLVAQISNLDIETRLNHYVTPDTIEEMQPDAVVIAAGATPMVLDIPGIARHNVITANDVLAGKIKTRMTVAVIGGGMIGCETADFLASKGKKVTIVEILDKLAQDMMPMIRHSLLDRLTEKGVTLLTGTQVEEVIDFGLIVRDKEGRVRKSDIETIVLAAGARACPVTAKSLEGQGFEMYVIGDCLEARRIKEAVREGFHAGLTV